MGVVQRAISVVEGAQREMESVTTRILAQAGLSEAAMRAPAGQVTSSTFGDLGGGGKALSEELGRLHEDLGKLIVVAQTGSDEATAAAAAGAGGTGGQAGSVSAGMQA